MYSNTKSPLPSPFRTVLLATLVLMISLPLQTMAQTVLEEVLVTATRRGETDIQTTPVTVSVVSSNDFGKLFAQDIGEVATFVPNFSAATVTGFNAASFAMRGAGETDIIVYFDPKVGVLLDDFVVPHVQTQLLEPFDIETIEVLRGPQGTLFGKNTTGGAVVVRTKRPDLEQNSAEASFQYGRFDDMKTKFALNMAVSDTLAFRFAGMYQNSDGYYKNGKVDVPLDAFGAGIGDAAAISGTTVAGDGRDLGGKDVFSGRFKVLWEPSDNISILGQYEIIRDSSKPVPVVNTTPAAAGQLATLFGFPGITGGDPLKQAGIHNSSIVGLDGDQRVDVDGGYLNIDWDLGSHTFSGVAGYRYQESRLPNEYLGTPYESFFSATRDDDRETFQLEGRIASQLDGKLNYVAGAFYQENDVEFCVLQQLGLTEFFGSAVPGILDNDNPLVLCNAQDATSWAVFGDVTYDINDKLQIGGGLRWTDEKKKYRAREGIPIPLLNDPAAVLANPLAAVDFTRFPEGNISTDSDSWGELTWRATASYQFTDNLFGYFTASKGFKSGGYNDQAGSGGFAFFPVGSYQPEFAQNYEIGFKADLMNDRLRLNVSYFHVDYDDFQRSTVVQVPGTAFQETRTFNAASVSAQGVEAEGTFQVTDNIVLRANIGWLDTEYDEFLLDRDNDPTTAPTDLSGRTVVRAPEVTAGIDLTYFQALQNDWGDVRWNFNFNYEDENTYYYNDDLGEAFDTVLEERTIVNLSATWTDASERYHVSAFGKNLTDDRYQTAAQAVGILWTFSNYGPPRTYGVEVGAKFDF
jgi:iron complex outermembrane recepter protein